MQLLRENREIWFPLHLLLGLCGVEVNAADLTLISNPCVNYPTQPRPDE